MKDAFTDKDVPVKLITDGGPQFSLREFKQFCGGWGITHLQSSPHYPKANRAAEAAGKSVKNLIIKVQIEAMFLSILSERPSLSTEKLCGRTV